MTLSRQTIEAMAPDQAALAAAAALLKPAKWPVRARADDVIWGECQGSGANPYRVVADTAANGSKCTCPSRKFPCKHVLALLWLSVEDGVDFSGGELPDWVRDWIGRRKRPDAAGAVRPVSAAKDIDGATLAVCPIPVDPETEKRRRLAAAKRAAETRRQALEGLDDLELWIADQLRTGLGGFVSEPAERCRRIAARLVDAKAGALASRIDEMPSRLLVLPPDERIDAVIAELGKLVVTSRAWRAEPDDPELRREVLGSETRDDLLADPSLVRMTATWEVVGERIRTRRDGLVSVTTWLMNLGAETPRFALLLDFFPASAGRRSAPFASGHRFKATLVFYPARSPMRAVIAERGDGDQMSEAAWPAAPEGDPLRAYRASLLAAPWLLDVPLQLPAGRVAIEQDGGRCWWIGEDAALPLSGSLPPVALGATFSGAVGIWTGSRLDLLAAGTNWGRLGFDVRA